MDRVLTLFPDSFNVRIQRAYLEFFWKGSTAPIKTALETLPPNLDPDGVVSFARWDVSLMDRDVVAAEKALTACQLDTIASQTGVPLPKAYLQACVDLLRGDLPKAQRGFEAARPLIEKTVANTMRAGGAGGSLGEIVDRLHQLRLRWIAMNVEDENAAVFETGEPELAAIIGESAMVRFVPPVDGNAVNDFAVVRRAGLCINGDEFVRAIAETFDAERPDIDKLFLALDPGEAR